MHEYERVYWLIASHYGSRPLRRALIESPGDLVALVKAQPEWAEWEQSLTREAMILDNFLKQGGHMLTFQDDFYPERWRTRNRLAPPLVVYALGDLNLLLGTRMVAFAGTRAPQETPTRLAQEESVNLSREGYTVITGFAPGIDLAVSEAVLEAGGTVIGILPQGLDTPATSTLVRRYFQYLNEHQLLFLSETHLKAPWSPQFAMMRNRLIAGLAEMLLIPEAGLKETVVNGKTRLSGTWACAETAHKMEVPVYAFDLDIEGNQALIRQQIAQPWGSRPLPEAQPSLFPEDA